MSLFRAEFTRFFARRFVRVMVVFLLGLLAAIAFGYAVNTQPIDDAVRRQAREQAVAQIAQMQASMEREYQNCLTEIATFPERYPPGFSCEDMRLKGGRGRPGRMGAEPSTAPVPLRARVRRRDVSRGGDPVPVRLRGGRVVRRGGVDLGGITNLLPVAAQPDPGLPHQADARPSAGSSWSGSRTWPSG